MFMESINYLSIIKQQLENTGFVKLGNLLSELIIKYKLSDKQYEELEDHIWALIKIEQLSVQDMQNADYMERFVKWNKSKL